MRLPDVASYLWHHGRPFRLAERPHVAPGERALQRLRAILVFPGVLGVDDVEVAALLAQVSSWLAARTWPELAGEGL